MVARIYLGLLVAIVLLQLGHTEKINKLLYKSCLEGKRNFFKIIVLLKV